MSTIAETAGSRLAIGAAIRAVCVNAGLTLQDAAAKLQMEVPVFRNIVTGGMAATEELLAKVQAEFGADVKAIVASVQTHVDALDSAITAELATLTPPAAPPVQQATPASATDPNPSHPGAVMPDGTVQQAEPAPLPDPQAASESPHSDVPGAGS